jgi:hypothetical protein
LIKSISPSGTVIISFSQNIIVPGNISSIDETALKIKIIPGKESLPQDLIIKNWTVKGRI